MHCEFVSAYTAVSSVGATRFAKVSQAEMTASDAPCLSFFAASENCERMIGNASAETPSITAPRYMSRPVPYANTRYSPVSSTNAASTTRSMSRSFEPGFAKKSVSKSSGATNSTTMVRTLQLTPKKTETWTGDQSKRSFV
eukprot:Amastigsp_a340061_23.p3 type:complete len:141 gc:universal Amastigsp_a340061_23:1310-888(-)